MLELAPHAEAEFSVDRKRAAHGPLRFLVDDDSSSRSGTGDKKLTEKLAHQTLTRPIAAIPPVSHAHTQSCFPAITSERWKYVGEEGVIDAMCKLPVDNVASLFCDLLDTAQAWASQSQLIKDTKVR